MFMRRDDSRMQKTDLKYQYITLNHGLAVFYTPGAGFLKKKFMSTSDLKHGKFYKFEQI